MTLRGSLNDILGMVGPRLGEIGNFNEMAAQQELDFNRMFAPQFQQLQLDMLGNDPLIKRLRNTAFSGLKGLQTGDLPADMRANIEQSTARSQMARGIFDSPAANTEAVAALMGGSEQIRASRLAQAGAVAGQFSAPGQLMQGGNMNFQQFLGAQQSTLGARQEQNNQRASLANNLYSQLGQLAGTAAAGGFGGFGGMFGGAAAGAGAGSMASQMRNYGANINPATGEPFGSWFEQGGSSFYK